MDFKKYEGMKRKELQALCKIHGIPANLTNLEMANRLSQAVKMKAKKVVKFSPETQTFTYEADLEDSMQQNGLKRKQLQSGLRRSARLNKTLTVSSSDELVIDTQNQHSLEASLPTPDEESGRSGFNLENDSIGDMVVSPYTLEIKSEGNQNETVSGSNKIESLEEVQMDQTDDIEFTEDEAIVAMNNDDDVLIATNEHLITSQATNPIKKFKQDESDSKMDIDGVEVAMPCQIDEHPVASEVEIHTTLNHHTNQNANSQDAEISSEATKSLGFSCKVIDAYVGIGSLINTFSPLGDKYDLPNFGGDLEGNTVGCYDVSNFCRDDSLDAEIGLDKEHNVSPQECTKEMLDNHHGIVEDKLNPSTDELLDATNKPVQEHSLSTQEYEEFLYNHKDSKSSETDDDLHEVEAFSGPRISTCTGQNMDFECIVPTPDNVVSGPCLLSEEFTSVETNMNVQSVGDKYGSQDIKGTSKQWLSGKGNSGAGNDYSYSRDNISELSDAANAAPAKQHNLSTQEYIEELLNSHIDSQSVSECLQESVAVSDSCISTPMRENMDASCFVPSSENHVSGLHARSAEITTLEMSTSLLEEDAEEDVMVNEDGVVSIERQVKEHHADMFVSQEVIPVIEDNSTEQDVASAIIQEYMDRETCMDEFVVERSDPSSVAKPNVNNSVISSIKEDNEAHHADDIISGMPNQDGVVGPFNLFDSEETMAYENNEAFVTSIDNETTCDAYDKSASESGRSMERVEHIVVSQHESLELQKFATYSDSREDSLTALCEPTKENGAEDEKQVESRSVGPPVSTMNDSGDNIGGTIQLKNTVSNADTHILDVVVDKLIPGVEEVEEKHDVLVDCEDIDNVLEPEQVDNVEDFQFPGEEGRQMNLDFVQEVALTESAECLGMKMNHPENMHNVHDMKENQPSTKGEHFGSVSASRKSSKRRPLQDLHKI